MSDFRDVVEVDGSVLEGGGQILRIALTISAIRKIPVRIFNIRSGRKKPGLMEQHLRGVELARDISNGKVEGAYLGSTEIKFYPGLLQGGYYKARVSTAGSISLLLQVAVPCALFANGPIEMDLEGGTNAELAPQVDYTTEVFRPIMEKFGSTFDFELVKRGYFPKGGGRVIVNVKPIRSLNSVEIVDQGEVRRVYGWSFVAGSLPIRLAESMMQGATTVLSKLTKDISIERYKEEPKIAPHPAAGIILVAETSTNCILGASALTRKNEEPIATGRRAAEELLKSVREGACVDEYSQDQVIVLMAFAKGSSRVRVGEVTLHTKTAMYVTELFPDSPKFTIIPGESSTLIECTGS